MKVFRLHRGLSRSTLDRVRAYGYSVGRCCYCGAPCRQIVCHAHSDLPALDPHVALAVGATWPTRLRADLAAGGA